jgi:hypothetical protein
MEFNYTACEIIKDNRYIESFYDSKMSVDVIYSSLLVFGLFITYFGNLYVENILSILGFFPGFYIIYYLTTILNSILNLSCSGIIVFSILAGILTSAISNYFIKFAYSCLGFLVGMSVGYVFNMVVLNHSNSGSIYIYKNSFIISELIFGSIGTILFYKKINHFLMIYTSLIGPYFMIKSFDKLFFNNSHNLSINLKKDNNLPNILYFIFYIISSISGVFFQYKRYKRTHRIRDIDFPINNNSELVY